MYIQPSSCPCESCPSSKCWLIETKLKGLIIQLNDGMQIALDYINRKHSSYKNLDPVSHGGENIRLRPPRNLEPWQSFDNHPLMKKLPERIPEAMKSLWDLQNKVFKYLPSFIFSELTAERDNIPQKAHMDYNPTHKLLVMCWLFSHSSRWMHSSVGVDRRI